MLLKNQWVNEEIKMYGMPKKQLLREKFIAIQAFLKKEEKSQINSLTCHIKNDKDQRGKQ